MKASKNRQRVTFGQAQDTLRLDAHIDATLSAVMSSRYVAYDKVGDAQASPAMTLLRAMLQARLNGTLYAQLDGNATMLAIAELCVPVALTYDATRLSRGYFQAYAEAAMRLATTRQLTLWLEQYRAKAEGRGGYALDVLCREALRGLAMLRAYMQAQGTEDKSDAAMTAIMSDDARRTFSAGEHRAWHKLTDSTHAYVGTGKLTRRERAQRHGHHARRKAERANGTPAHH